MWPNLYFGFKITTAEHRLKGETPVLRKRSLQSGSFKIELFLFLDILILYILILITKIHIIFGVSSDISAINASLLSAGWKAKHGCFESVCCKVGPSKELLCQTESRERRARLCRHSRSVGKAVRSGLVSYRLQGPGPVPRGTVWQGYAEKQPTRTKTRFAYNPSCWSYFPHGTSVFVFKMK